MWNRLGLDRLVPRLVLLGLIVSVFGLIAMVIGTMVFKTDTKTGLIALVTCLISSVLAHIASEYPKGDLLVMARMAVQIVVRTILPFVVAVWGIYFAQPPLEKSLVFYMILFYMVGLVVDVQLSLTRLNAEK